MTTDEKLDVLRENIEAALRSQFMLQSVKEELREKLAWIDEKRPQAITPRFTATLHYSATCEGTTLWMFSEQAYTKGAFMRRLVEVMGEYYAQGTTLYVGAPDSEDRVAKILLTPTLIEKISSESDSGISINLQTYSNGS